MILLYLLVLSTVLYTAFSAYQDLKERMIYCVPCNVLTLLWGVCLWRDRNLSVMYLIAFWLVHIMIYLFLNHFGIWGGGDSDFLFLFANVFLFALGTANAYETAILECICLCMALLLSIVIGCIEGKIGRAHV